MTDEMKAHYRRAFERAGEVLKRGDRVRVRTCGDGHSTYTFDRWSKKHAGFFISKSGIEELHAFNVTAVNGLLVSFRDPERLAA